MTRSDSSVPARAFSLAMHDPRAVLVLVAVYLAAGLAFILTDYSLNDEGLVTVVWASAARHEPLAVLFFQKAKPVLSLLYLPAAALGARPALAIHVGVASLSIPLMAAVARVLRLRLPNLPALVVALSPLYFLGGAAGISNVDGVVGTSLFLYLLVARKSDWWAGAVLGTLPWVRHELAFLVAVVLVWAILFERSRRLILGTLAFPAVYGLAGAVYHHDVLWLLHYPPTTLYPMPNNPVWESFSVTGLFVNLLSITPAIAFCVFVRARHLTSIERMLLAYALGWFFLVSVLPIFRIANFGFLPRYALQVLPAVALLSARAVEPFGGRKGTAAALGVVALSVAGPLLPLRLEISWKELAPYLPAMAAWLRDHPDRARGPVYTNAPLLSYYLDEAGDVPGVDVRYMMGVDQYYDVVEMSDGENGQRDALRRMIPLDLYGHGVTPDALSPASIPDDATFALRDDKRLGLLLPETTWAAHLSLLNEGARYRVLRFVSKAPRPSGALVPAR